MTPAQYRCILKRLGLSQRKAGPFLGVNERTSRKWIAGDSPVPLSAALLLRLMVKLKLSPDEVKRLAAD